MTLAIPNRQTDLTKYEPERGLKTIRVLEAAEKHYRKAKDGAKLAKAIRAKLEAQGDFVLWWDTKGPGTNHGLGRGKKVSDPKPFSTDDWKVIVHRWRRKLGDSPESFELACQEAIAKATAAVEGGGAGAHVGQNTGDSEWFTPRAIIEAARATMGAIDLDPCSTAAANTVVGATTYYTKTQDGLSQPWRGRVWMNPPYATALIEAFVDRYVLACIDGMDGLGDGQGGLSDGVTEGVVLVNNATETGWWQKLADHSQLVCFPKGRVQFWHPDKPTATPLQGQSILYCGTHTREFRELFRPFGLVVDCYD